MGANLARELEWSSLLLPRGASAAPQPVALKRKSSMGLSLIATQASKQAVDLVVEQEEGWGQVGGSCTHF